MRTRYLVILLGGLVGGCGGGGSSSTADMKEPDLKMSATGGDMKKVAGLCNPVQQTCPDDTDNCTFVDDGSGSGGIIQQCVPTTGSKMVGDSCKRTSNDAPGIGHDDCAKGAYCSGLGSLNMTTPMRHCRKYCDSDAACDMTQFCSNLSDTVGLCIPSCTPFGTDCPGTLTCGNLIGDIDGQSVGVACRAVGKAAIGAACMDDTSCVADSFCNGNTMKCNALCDDKHACATGMCKDGICQ